MVAFRESTYIQEILTRQTMFHYYKDAWSHVTRYIATNKDRYVHCCQGLYFLLGKQDWLAEVGATTWWFGVDPVFFLSTLAFFLAFFPSL